MAPDLVELARIAEVDQAAAKAKAKAAAAAAKAQAVKDAAVKAKAAAKAIAEAERIRNLPTRAQEQAIASAQEILGLDGYSRVGLIQQLTSSYGLSPGLAKADAVYAVNHIKVDWNREAVESAQSYVQNYLDDGWGSLRADLIQFLTAGEGFTLKQATYAVNKVRL